MRCRARVAASSGGARKASFLRALVASEVLTIIICQPSSKSWGPGRRTPPGPTETGEPGEIQGGEARSGVGESPRSGAASRALRADGAAAPVRDRGAGCLPPGRDAGVPAPLHRRGGDRRRGLRAPAADRLGDLDASRPRARAGQGRRSAAGDGRALRQVRRALRRPGRHHAPLRPQRRALRDQRHRRRRDRPCGGRRARGAAQGHRRPRGGVLRRRRLEPRGVPRGAELRRRAARADGLRLREQPLRHRDAAEVGDAQPRDRHAGGGLRDAGGRRRRQRRLRGVAGDEGGVRAGALGGRADADRGQDLPHRRPPRGRPGGRHLPDPGGDRRLGEARPDRDVPPAGGRGVRRRRRRPSSRRSRRGSRRWSTTRLEFARSSPEPDPATVRRHVYADPINPPEALRPREASGTRVQGWLEAVRDGIAEEMRANPNILYFGEGTGERGGSFAHTKDLWQEFGGRADGRHADLRAGVHRGGGRGVGHRGAHGLGPDVRRLRLRDGGADLPAGGEAALHEQRQDQRADGGAGRRRGAAQLGAAPQRQLSSDVRAHAGARSSACRRRRPTPRG